jgi:EmrB/QacA subfamily drug resistance transporter
MTGETVPDGTGGSGVDPVVMRTGLALVAGGMAPVFDSTIVAIALHTLSDRLGASVGTIQWVSTGYLLALAVVIPLVAWAQARIGGKRLWLGALTAFLAGSVLCALSWNAPSLIAFRVVQGLGGGIMFPLMQSLVMQAARGRAMGRTVAMISLPVALGPIVGPVVGGVVLHWLDWRWLFLVNVPICAVAWLMARRMLPDDRPAPGAARPRLDAVGFTLLSPALVALLLGLSNVESSGGPAHPDVLVPLITGVVLLVCFLGYAVRRGKRALLDVRLLSGGPLALSSATLFLSGIVLYGAMLLLPLYWQELRGESVLAAALLLIPQGVGSLLTRTLAGRLTDAVGARWVAAAGFAVIGLGTVPFAFAGDRTSAWWLGTVLLVRGLGLGMVMIPVMTVAYTGLEHARIPQASMITRIGQQLGGSFGTAVLAVVLERKLDHGAAAAFDTAFRWTVAFCAVAVGLSLFLPGRPAPEPAAPSRPAEPTSVGHD